MFINEIYKIKKNVKILDESYVQFNGQVRLTEHFLLILSEINN